MAIFKHSYCITGSIGSGKSSVCLLLKMYGFEIIDADLIAHEILDQNSADIKELFGNDVISSDGKVDRKILGALVFGSSAMRFKLDELLGLKIRDRIFMMCQSASLKGLPYFVDLPLYFERYEFYKNCFEKVIVVYAPNDILLQRIIKRNNLPLEQAKNRLAAQISIETKRKNADILIDNSKTLSELNSQVDELIDVIKEEYESIKI